MTPPELGDLLKQAQEAQAKIAKLQETLAKRRIEGEAGGGMVVVAVSGALRVLEIKIDSALFKAGDQDMIQDLTAAAINAALANAQRIAQEEFQRVSMGFQLPGNTEPGNPQ
jgi:DNA-binding YbaB/EbfC family protein